MSSEFGPITDYLPHRPPMVMIEEIVEVLTNSGTCRTTIRPDCIFAIDGKVHPSAMIEFVAQVCSICVGVTAAREGGPPRMGLIMGCREVTFAIPHFDVGDQIEITIEKIFGEIQVAAFTGVVKRRGEIVTTVHLSVVDAEAAANHGAGFASAFTGGDAS